LQKVRAKKLSQVVKAAEVPQEEEEEAADAGS
jgi:hypothetical protein